MAGWNNSSLTRRLGSLHPPEENVTAPVCFVLHSFSLFLLPFAPFNFFVFIGRTLSDQILFIQKRWCIVSSSLIIISTGYGWHNSLTAIQFRNHNNWLFLSFNAMFFYFPFTYRHSRRQFMCVTLLILWIQCQFHCHRLFKPQDFLRAQNTF